MKSGIGIGILLALAATTSADSVDYLNWIRQVQADSGVEWDVAVAARGDKLSERGVGPRGSTFELWTLNRTSSREFLLDTDFVRAYGPKATIEIKTGDPYQANPRTRVDQPFSVSVVVSGLSSDLDDPIETRQVAFDHDTYNYLPHHYPGAGAKTGNGNASGVDDGNGNANGAPRRKHLNRAYLEGNRSFKFFFGATNLTGKDVTTIAGEEIFTVMALDDYSESEPILASKRLQVWPIATASIRGLDPDSKYSSLPLITVELEDLYPDSTTWVRFYHGEPSADPVDPIVLNASVVVIVNSVPQNRTVLLKNIDGYFEADGKYTMEVLHQTPFGVDLLGTQPLVIKKVISVRGALYSSD